MLPTAFSPTFVLILLWLAFGKLLSIGFFSLLARQPGLRARRVIAAEVGREQTRRELRSAWLVLTDPAVLALLVWMGWIRFAEETWAHAAFTAAVFFLWAEVWFYGTHRLMHKSDWLWAFHEKHHLSEVPQPLTATSFSLVEKLFFYTCGWLGFLAVLSWWAPVSLYGIAAFYSYYFITSPLAHSNLELQPAWVHDLPGGLGKILGTATGHAVHHGRHDLNYGFITSVLDRVFGTYWAGTEDALRQVAEGRALSPAELPRAAGREQTS